MKNQKGISQVIFIIIIIALLAIAGLFAYLYYIAQKPAIQSTNQSQVQNQNQQTQNQNTETNSVSQNQNSQTAGWKTYTNSQYGFEFKYPTNASIIENGVNRIQISVPFTQSIAGALEKTFLVSIDNINFCDYAYENYTQKIAIDSVDFKKDIDMTGGTQTRAYGVDYRTRKENKCLSISFRIAGEKYSSFDSAKESEIFNQIVSTFKFTR